MIIPIHSRSSKNANPYKLLSPSKHGVFSVLEVGEFQHISMPTQDAHYNREIIDGLLSMTSLLKLNSSELFLITDWYCFASCRI